jgi:beta-1,4-N-acetylglucosaminyltransferase
MPNSNGVKDFPDVILCNGPATATIVIFTSILLRFFDVGGCNTRGKMRTVYIESWARVKRLSLSGKILSRIVDRFLVQWPQLEAATSGRGQYIGVLV